ncbi:MAG: FAD-dependent oxidoreductase [Gemmatimonadetes bacterium]|nr:FAD-dependent oxidoreductase [Gemmatimonadota bacterium]
MERFDVVVIGGGAAGVAAALSATRAGARVALVRSGPGATALMAGGWHDAPPSSLVDALAGAGHELTGCQGPLPHPDGTVVPCAIAPPSHAAASLTHDAASVMVCGIAGLPGFRAAALAALWSDAAGLPEALESVTVTLDATPAAGWSPVSLAAHLDRDPDLLPRALTGVVRERRPDRVILPAVLGLDDPARVLAALTDRVGVPAGEALGSLPSVPGWRLDRALQRVMADAGVRMIAGRVIAADVQERTVRSVTIAAGIARASNGGSALGPTVTAAGCYILATGKYIGGGITADAEFEEPALGCDVALERFARTIDDPGAALVLTDPVRSEAQPVLSAGVRVDRDGRPLNPGGDVFVANVFVAGAVRAGTETAALGLGTATRDGWTAGERAATHASGTER